MRRTTACLLGLAGSWLAAGAGLAPGAASANPALPMSIADLLMAGAFVPGSFVPSSFAPGAAAPAAPAALLPAALPPGLATAVAPFLAGLVPVRYLPSPSGYGHPRPLRRLDHRRRRLS